MEFPGANSYADGRPWAWNNRPSALHGIFKGKERYPVNRFNIHVRWRGPIASIAGVIYPHLPCPIGPP
eukprot:1188341-Prorocentrum_minimum.AAC.2